MSDKPTTAELITMLHTVAGFHHTDHNLYSQLKAAAGRLEAAKPAGTIITETICPYPSPSDDTVINYGVWFQSAAAGLWYQNKDAAGTLSAVKVDGLIYSPPEDK